jgi:hypothetical protein
VADNNPPAKVLQQPRNNRGELGRIHDVARGDSVDVSWAHVTTGIEQGRPFAFDVALRREQDDAHFDDAVIGAKSGGLEIECSESGHLYPSCAWRPVSRRINADS